MERKGGYCSVVMDEVQSLGQWGDSFRDANADASLFE